MAKSCPLYGVNCPTDIIRRTFGDNPASNFLSSLSSSCGIWKGSIQSYIRTLLSVSHTSHSILRLKSDTHTTRSHSRITLFGGIQSVAALRQCPTIFTPTARAGNNQSIQSRRNRLTCSNLTPYFFNIITNRIPNIVRANASLPRGGCAQRSRPIHHCVPSAR